MIIGTYNDLTVVRETDISYILTDGKQEVFLHKKETDKPLKTNQRIRVFIYVDNQGRPTASTKTVNISLDDGGFLEVVDVNYDLGVFLDNGLVKDLLLSKDDLPFNLDSWPVAGDFLFVVLKNRKDTLFAKFVGRKEIAGYFPAAVELTIDDHVQSHVQYLLPEGLVAFTRSGHEIFVHVNNTRRSYRLGEKVSPRILKHNPSDEYVGSLIETKETMIKEDARAILEYLKDRGGIMRFTDSSSPEEIQAAFNMSKSAFKRALGSLYKQGYVELLPDKTKITTKI